MENTESPILVPLSPSSSSKKPFIIAAIVCFVVLILSIVIYIVLNQKSIYRSKADNFSTPFVKGGPTQKSSPTSQQMRPNTDTDIRPSGMNTASNLSLPSASKQDVSTLLINKEDADAMKKDYQDRMSKARLPIPTPIKYDFKFQLSPELQNSRSINYLIPGFTVFAANACNLANVPSSLYIYKLRTNIVEKQANEEAIKFNLSPPAYSAGDYAGTISYQFQDLSTTNPRYYNIINSSGVYKFHDAATPSGALISEASAKTISNTQLSKLGLSSLFLFDSIDSSSANYFIIRYKKQLRGLSIIDENVIKTFPSTSPVCDLGANTFASEMSFIDVQISKNGGIISNFVNSTRFFLSEKEVKRQTLEESLKEYSDPKKSIAPIILSQGEATSGTVIVDEAYVAYYDLGSLAAQTLYIPMYVTSGKIGSTRVFTIVPAIPLSEITKENEIDTPTPISAFTSLKQASIPLIQPTPPPPPPLPSPPPAKGKNFTCEGDVAGYKTCTHCPGGLIDRWKVCVCNGVSRSFPMESIPSKICPATCTKTDTVEKIGGQSCACSIKDCPC